MLRRHPQSDRVTRFRPTIEALEDRNLLATSGGLDATTMSSSPSSDQATTSSANTALVPKSNLDYANQAIATLQKDAAAYQDAPSGFAGLLKILSEYVRVIEDVASAEMEASSSMQFGVIQQLESDLDGATLDLLFSFAAFATNPSGKGSSTPAPSPSPTQTPTPSNLFFAVTLTGTINDHAESSFVVGGQPRGPFSATVNGTAHMTAIPNPDGTYHVQGTLSVSQSQPDPAGFENVAGDYSFVFDTFAGADHYTIYANRTSPTTNTLVLSGTFDPATGFNGSWTYQATYPAAAQSGKVSSTFPLPS
jgi:hypothetical protein